MEAIDVDAPSTNFYDMTATPTKVPSLQRAMDEANAAPIATPSTLASESSTPTEISTEELGVAPSPVEAEQSFTHTIESQCFSTIHHPCWR